MVSRVKAGMVILCIMVLVLLIAGCTRPAEVKTTTTYSLNRGTNLVEGTLMNDGDVAVHARVYVTCRSTKGVNATVFSADTPLLIPGQTISWKTGPLPVLTGGDNYVACKLDRVKTFTKDQTD